MYVYFEPNYEKRVVSKTTLTDDELRNFVNAVCHTEQHNDPYKQQLNMDIRYLVTTHLKLTDPKDIDMAVYNFACVCRKKRRIFKRSWDIQIEDVEKDDAIFKVVRFSKKDNWWTRNISDKLFSVKPHVYNIFVCTDSEQIPSDDVFI